MPKTGELPRKRAERMKQKAEQPGAQRRSLLGDPKKPAAKPAAAPAEGRMSREEKQAARRTLVEILTDRDDDIMDVVDNAVAGAKPDPF